MSLSPAYGQDLAHYQRMLKAGIPQAAVEEAMASDGFDPSSLYARETKQAEPYNAFEGKHQDFSSSPLPMLTKEELAIYEAESRGLMSKNQLGQPPAQRAFNNSNSTLFPPGLTKEELEIYKAESEGLKNTMKHSDSQDSGNSRSGDLPRKQSVVKLKVSEITTNSKRKLSDFSIASQRKLGSLRENSREGLEKVKEKVKRLGSLAEKKFKTLRKTRPKESLQKPFEHEAVRKRKQKDKGLASVNLNFAQPQYHAMPQPQQRAVQTFHNTDEEELPPAFTPNKSYSHNNSSKDNDGNMNQSGLEKKSASRKAYYSPFAEQPTPVTAFNRNPMFRSHSEMLREVNDLI